MPDQSFEQIQYMRMYNARKAKRKGYVKFLFSFIKYILLTAGAMVMLLPFLWMLSTSFSPDSVIITYDIIPKKLTFINYIKAWSFSQKFDETVTMGTFLLNSVIVTVLITISGLIVDSLAGYVFARRNIPGKSLLFYLALMTMMIPFYVIAVPMFLTVKGFGWLDSYQGQVIPFIASGFGIFMFKQFFQDIPQDLEDAARIDGCSPFRIYSTIMMPLAKPVVGTMTIFKAMWGWNLFMWPLLIINNIFYKPLPLALTMFRGLNVTQWGMLSAGMTIATIPIVVLYLSMQGMFHKGIMAGSIKG